MDAWCAGKRTEGAARGCERPMTFLPRSLGAALRHVSVHHFVSVWLGLAITILLGSQCAGDGTSFSEDPKSVVLHNALATVKIDKATGATTSCHCNDGINLVREI